MNLRRWVTHCFLRCNLAAATLTRWMAELGLSRTFLKAQHSSFLLSLSIHSIFLTLSEAVQSDGSWQVQEFYLPPGTMVEQGVANSTLATVD